MGASEPAISPTIVIPTTMRRETVAPVAEAAVEAVSGFERGEVIVVANGPEAGRRPLDYRSPRLRIVECPVQRMSTARNAGLARARNDVVLLTDDDCVVSPEWAERLTRRLHAGEVSVATPLRVPREGLLTTFLDYQRIFHPRPIDAATVDYPLAASMGIRRDLVGFGFDEDLDSGDEPEFGMRLHDAGIATSYEPGTPPPLHLVLERLESVTERFHRYGVSNARLLLQKGRGGFSIPSPTDLYSSLCGNRITTPRRFAELPDRELRQGFAALELVLLGSFLVGYLDEAGRALGREIIRLDRERLEGGWIELERRLAEEFSWDGDWNRLPVDFEAWLTPGEAAPPALAPAVADVLRQGAPLVHEPGAEPRLDGGERGDRRARELRARVEEVWRELTEGRLPADEEAIASRLREAGVTYRDGLHAMETIALGPVEANSASPSSGDPERPPRMTARATWPSLRWCGLVAA
jgi:glycosyltransferase involved in cell wall biosynthesis